MAAYTEISRSTAEELLAAYALRLRRLSLLSGGAANTSYLVDTDKGPHVLAILDNHDRHSAGRLATLLQHLAEHEIPTDPPLRTQDGRTLEWFGNRPVMVKSYFSGSCDPRLPAHNLAVAGRLLAMVHAVPAPDWLPRHGRRLPADWQAVTEKFDDREFAEWLHQQHGLAEEVLLLNGPAGLIHGDYFADNLIVGDDNHITVLDWETAAHDLLILDVGMAILGLCNEAGIFRPDRATTLLDGYEAIRQLGESERQVLYEAVVYASVIIAYHRYRRHHLTHPDPTKAELYREIPRFVSSLDRRSLPT